MKVREIVALLEEIAPPHLAADWDNVGLLIGDGKRQVGALMLCIDLTEQVLAEAKRAKAAMVMAYHPVIFHAAKRVTASACPVVYEAAASKLAVYSMHTALDVAPGGTNDVLAEVLGLVDARPIQPTVRAGDRKVVVFVPVADLSRVADAAFAAGAGRIGNYERCAFFSHGIGAFLPMAHSRPAVGEVGREEATEELRLEMVAPENKLPKVCSAIRVAHSYEDPAIDLYPRDEALEGFGMGRIGKLPRPVTTGTLISRIKKRTGLKRLLVARSSGTGRLVTTAACAAGSAGAVYKAAYAAGATLYLTGEMRHHDALAATAAGVDVVCLGHSNSERMALKRLAKRLMPLLPKTKVLMAKSDVDPFQIV